jgi:hypothetical protein
MKEVFIYTSKYKIYETWSFEYEEHEPFSGFLNIDLSIAKKY